MRAIFDCLWISQFRIGTTFGGSLIYIGGHILKVQMHAIITVLPDCVGN